MVNEDNDTFTDLLKRLNVIIHVNYLTQYLAHFKYSTISDVIITVLFTFKINAKNLLEEKDMEHQLKFWSQKSGLNVAVDGLGLVHQAAETSRHKAYVTGGNCMHVPEICLMLKTASRPFPM